MAIPFVLQFITEVDQFLTWDFDGLNSPALDVGTDETPPTHRGAIRSLFRKINNVFVTEPETAVKFYFDQGITAQDLTLMEGADVAALVPIETIRARTEAPDGSRRGTVVPWSNPLTQFTTVYIPIETPP